MAFAFALPAMGADTAANTEVEVVNYDDPNLAYTNEYVGDTAGTCSKALKGKALDLCLERNGLSKSDVAQASPLPESRSSSRSAR